MKEVTTFYISRVLKRSVFSSSDEPLGKILDILVGVSSGQPQVIALKCKVGGKSRIVDYSTFTVNEEEGQYVFRCSNIDQIITELKENTLSLVNNVYDKQLVDIDGRKLVRVNDIRLAVLVTGTFVVAVDVGLEGLLRRLGIAKPLVSLGVKIPNRLILWDEVEAVDFSHAGITLSKPFQKLSTLHVSDMAEIIEDMNAKMQVNVFAALDNEKAADVLEELETKAQLNVLKSMTVEKAADVLELMPSDEVADILDELDEEHQEVLLSEMESETSDEVRELLEYEDDEIGSLMTTEYVSFSMNMTVGETIDELRRQKPESDAIYYLYIVDESGRLAATVSLRDIVISQPEVKLSEIMNKNVVSVFDTDELDTIAEIISKYNLLAVPVVDKDMIMMGMVVIDDVVYNLLKSTRTRI